MGYFSHNRFVNKEGEKTDEIALNPSYFAAVPIVQVMQTMAHEMCHQYQHYHGKPGRSRYHNIEFGGIMKARGLMPSSTGRPGGQTTGDRMSDYPIPKGLFIEACRDLLTQNYRISWYDRYIVPISVRLQDDQTLDLPDAGKEIPNVDLAKPDNKKNKSNRAKYTCSCKTNIWGKPDLRIFCETCKSHFKEIGLF